MEKQEYQKLCELLIKRRAELEKQLAENDYSGTISVTFSKHEQIQAIGILMEQLQYLANPPAMTGGSGRDAAESETTR